MEKEYIEQLVKEMIGRYEYLCPMCGHDRFRMYAVRCVADIYLGVVQGWGKSDGPDYFIECQNCHHELTCGAAGG